MSEELGRPIARGYVTIVDINDGEPAQVYKLVPSVGSVTRKLNGTLSVSLVGCSVYKITGKGAYELTDEKELVWRRLPDKTAWQTAAHPGGLTSTPVAVKPDTERIDFELRDGTAVLDRVSVNVFVDASDLEHGIDKYKYLFEATSEGETTTNKGLILSSLIMLRDGSKTVWSGINGTTPLGECSIAAWYGGDMEDRFEYDASTGRYKEKTTIPARAAMSIDRMDGTGYRAGGNMRWERDGSVTFGNGIKIDLGSGTTTLGTLNNNIASLLTQFNNLANKFYPVDSNQQRLSWASDPKTWHSIKSEFGLWTEQFLSAKGRSSGSGSGSGSQFGLYTNWLSTPQSTDALGAVLGKSLYTQQNRNTSDIASLKGRVATLEGKNYLSDLTLSQAGSGNAVTAVSLSADKKTLTVTKGATFLTSHQALDHINSLDTRSVQTLPNSYGAQLRVNFKYNSTNGLSDGGSYNTELWIKGYGGGTDHSGGYAHQLGFTANGNIWHRIGTSATTWGTWRKLLDSENTKISGGTITINGASITPLTSHQGIYNLTIQRNGVTVDTFDPDSAAKTINISDVASAATLSSHTGNTTIHITASERTAWNNKVDKVSGKGLSTNDFDDTLLAKLNGIAPGANKYVLPTASASVLGGVKVGSGLAISSGVLSVSLSASHIPNLSWSKITSDKPTTLAGYGITDAKISGGVITLGSNTITPLVSHQAIYSLTFASGTFSAKTFNPKSAAATVNIPTTTAHIAESTNLYFTNARAVSALKSTTDALQASINAKLDKTTFDKFLTLFNAMFERVNIGTTAAPVYAIKAKYGLYTEHFLTAKGLASGTGGTSGGGSQFGLMRSWPSSSPGADTTDALGANLGYQLYINKADKTTVSGHALRLTALEQKNYLNDLTLVPSGSGNAVTAVSLSSDKKTITVTKGATFLTSHQSLANYVTLNTTQTISGAKTFGSSIKTNGQRGAWLIGKTEAAIMFNGLTAIDSNAAWYFYNMKSKSGHTIAFGGLGDNIGFYTFLAGRTENGTDSSLVCNTATGQWTTNKNFTAYGFVRTGSSNSYLLLGGGGHKALTDITSAYVTALGTSGNYLTWTKNGATSNITVPFATNAASLGGVAASNYLTKSNYSSTLDSRYYTKTEVNAKDYIKVVNCYKTTEWSDVRSTSDPLTLRAYDVYGTEAGGPTTYGDVLEIVGRSGHWQPQLWFDDGKTGNVRHRNKTYSDDTWGNWYVLLDTRNYSSYLDTRYYTESEVNAKLTNGSVTKVGTATVGSTTKGVYLNAGTPTAMTYSLSATLNAGTAGKLAYYSGANAVDDYTSTVGSSTKPIYLNGGVPTASNATVGSSSRLMYLNSGTLTASSSTIGASDKPVYLSGGYITAVSSVGEAYLSWGGKSISGSISPLDCAASAFHSANRIAFANPAGIKVEYSRNGGSSWTDYGASAAAKTHLVSGQGTSLNIGGTTTGVTTAYRLRVTLDASTMGVYTRARKLLLNIATNGASGCKVLVETATKGSPSSFTTVNTYDISGWSGWNSIPLAAIYFGGSVSQTTNTGFIRLTFYITALSSNTSYSSALSLYDIVMLGDKYWTNPSNLAKTGHLYSYDGSQNATFPAAVTATSFNGTLNGTATSAQKLSTPRSINGSTFDGTASITTVKWGTARNIGILSNDGTSTPSTVSVDGSGNVDLRLPATIKAALTGNATTATGLQTARTLTVGNTGKSFNGTANVTWSLDEIGVYSKTAADSRYVNVGGDTMTGLLTTTTGNHGGLKIGGSYLTANGNDMVLQVARALRFGADAWDANQWAGLKYTHTTKTIALGIADGTDFSANTAQTGGTLKLVNCNLLLGGGDKITFGSDDNAYLNYNSEGKLVLFGKSGINLNTNGRPISANANIATTGTFSSSSDGRSSLPNLSVSYTNNSYTLSTSSFICNSWVRTVGSSGWYSETYGGGWRMTDSTYIRNYGTKRVLLDAGAVFNALQIAGGGVYIDNMAGGNPAFNYGYGALTVGIKNDSSQSPLIVACRQNQSLSGSTRLFAMELLNSGERLCFGFGGATKFRFQNTGVLYAAGGMYTDGFMTAKTTGSSSDARLKTNIRELCLPLETIVGAPSVAFDWKDGKGRGAGTIAQYWLDKLPEVLLTDPEGFYAVNYGALAHVEISSLAKHLVPRVEKAEEKINRLERRVAILEKALAECGNGKPLGPRTKDRRNNN